MPRFNLQKLLPGIQKNIPLKDYTTFKIGGPAKYFYVAETKEDLMGAVKLAKKNNLPFFILGGGSNLLVADEGFKGLVIKIQNTKYKVQNSQICAEAGVRLSQVLLAALKNNLTGLEWTVCVPGAVGGAVYGNAGAYGISMKDLVKIVEVFDMRDEEVKSFKNKDCQFGYRHSIFKKSKNLVILSAEIQLKKSEKEKIKEKIKQYLNYRDKTQPLSFPSAGSIFKNQKSKIKNQKLLKEFPELKEFSKKGLIPAGYLIEKCGLKGKKIGNIKVSEKHANFIVNLGNGKAKDVLKLINLIKQKVKNKFGTELEEEICYL